MKAINEILRGLREDRDLKQSDIAELIKTTQQQYSNYEKGENELPLRAFFILADYYGVSADYLMGRKDVMHGVPGLDKKVTDKQTAGEVLSDILSLETAGREAVTEYIALQKIKECCARKREKDGCPLV
ncbi:MAG: helix-turn-helix domain-containing protein [Oscillospiraceae bacterium]|nr:helix-turn-helix domain-containing protein [Oscillospiraceae bacterium]